MKPWLLACAAGSLATLMLAGCGLRGSLTLPEGKPVQSGSGAQAGSPATEGKPNSTLPQPAPQAQKRDRTTPPAN
jgi:predicted small lipoprotein YifL